MKLEFNIYISNIRLKRKIRFSFLLTVCIFMLQHNLDSRMNYSTKHECLMKNKTYGYEYCGITNLESPPLYFVYNETGLFETLVENVSSTVKFSRNNTLTMKRISALGAGMLADVDCNTFPVSSPSNPPHIAGSHSMFDLEFNSANGVTGTVTYEFEFSDVLSNSGYSGYMMFVDIDNKETFRIKAYDASGNIIPFNQFSFVRENGNYATGSSYTNTVFNDIGASYSGELTSLSEITVSDPVVTLQASIPVKRVVFEINFNVDNNVNETKSASFGFINATTPSTVYVNHAATGSNNGTSWTDAFTTFQAGYENSFEGDQLWVAKGVYKPSSTNLLPNTTTRNNHFRIPEGVEVYGGFAGTESSPGQRVNFKFGESNNTILSGDLGGNDNYTATPWTGTSENTYHVIYQPNEESCKLNQNTILDGFSIIGGYANGTGTDNNNDGGGFFLDDHSPILRNIDLINNACIDKGGGMYMIDCQSVLENIIARNNRAETTGGDGGGMYILDSGPAFTNCLIVDNYTGTDGGGLYIETSTVTMNNATIANNRADDDGGGIYLTSGVNTDNIQLRNSIVWGNSAGDAANQIRRGTALAVLINSLYSNGTNDVSLSTPSPGSANNLTSDPQFINAALKDYRIKRASPAADAGNDTYNTLTTDIRRGNFPRKLLKTDHTQTGTIDMGAFEYNQSIEDSDEDGFADNLDCDYATITYTGASIATTSNKSASLSLSATVSLPAVGDVTQTQLRFINRDTGQPISGWLSVTAGAQPNIGTASYGQHTLTLGTNEIYRKFSIGLEVGGTGCSTRNHAADNVTVTVAEPSCGCY